MSFFEKPRARRRRLTLTVALRRRDHHLTVVHGGAENVDCTCELANTYFAKRVALACDCRKRRKGQPKVASGMCHIGMRDRVYDWRNEVRELRVAALVGRGFEEEPEHFWPGKKTGPKLFTIETRQLNPKGEPRGAWYPLHTRYRTAADRDNALHSRRANARSYPGPRWGAPGEEVAYRGPREEFRAGPDPEVEGMKTDAPAPRLP